MRPLDAGGRLPGMLPSAHRRSRSSVRHSHKRARIRFERSMPDSSETSSRNRSNSGDNVSIMRGIRHSLIGGRSASGMPSAYPACVPGAVYPTKASCGQRRESVEFAAVRKSSPWGYCTMSAGTSLPSWAGAEPLVDAKQLAAHLHFGVRLVRKLAQQQLIPAIDYVNGTRHYYRFHISEVEAALRNKK